MQRRNVYKITNTTVSEKKISGKNRNRKIEKIETEKSINRKIEEKIEIQERIVIGLFA